MKVELPPSVLSMRDARFASPGLDIGVPDFCAGARVERARVAADMRRRAADCREAVAKLRAEPPTVSEDEIADSAPDFFKAPERVRQDLMRMARESIDRMTREYVKGFLLQASVFDDYAEDLERVPT